ncbi:MAG: hypothetical protein NC124_21455 [Clostridium sp.]|nr:hypothetical protein [Clostridium sp.]
MNSIIIESLHESQTYLKKIFVALNNRQMEYNWLITDYECYPQNQEIARKFLKEYCWFSGKELTKLVEEENFQWIWGVISGFKPNISLERILEYDFPIADGNSKFWENPVFIQYPLADIEIVAWDGKLTLFLCKENRHAESIYNSFSYAEDLERYNSKTG